MPPAFLAFTAQAMSLGSLLSGSRSYAIPIFQRSYSWTSVEVGQLMADLWLGVMEARELQLRYGGLFLGSLVVVDTTVSPHLHQSPVEPEAFQVIDGKQRLTTLTILLAALRDRLGAAVPWIDGLISHVDDQGQESQRSGRLKLGIEEDGFFGVQVRRQGASLSPIEPDGDNLGWRCIRECQNTILDDFEDRSDEELAELAEFLRDRVALALISAPDIDTGFRVFLSTNHRGKPLSSTDILKAELVAAVPEEDRERCLVRWRESEELLGDDFGLLPDYLHELHDGGGGATIREVLALSHRQGGARRFLDEVLFPAAETLHPILHAAFAASPQAHRINHSLRILSWLNTDVWVPPALAFASRFPDQADGLADFLETLERFACAMQIIGVGGDRCVGRYREVIEALSEDALTVGRRGLLVLSPEEHAKLLLKTSSNLHQRASANCKLLLKRLSASYSGDVAVDSLKEITVEHVLPTSPTGKSPWFREIPDSEDRLTCNKLLGNLVLVSAQQNREARNLGLGAKLNIVFPGGQPSPHAITNQLLGVRTWNADDIRRRDAALKQRIREIWRIPDKIEPARKRPGNQN